MTITFVRGPHKNPRIDGLSGVQRLHWILEFTRRDLDGVAADEFRAIGDDLRHVAAPWWVNQTPRPCPAEEEPDMSPAQVRALQTEIREGLDAVMGTLFDVSDMIRMHRGRVSPQGGWELPAAPTRVCRVEYIPGSYVRILAMSESTNDRTAILTGVANLLIAFGDRVSACPVCGTLFLRRYRQVYCTVRCSDKVRNRRRLDRKARQRKSEGLHTTRMADATSLTTA
jgi:hypothetical protein